MKQMVEFISLGYTGQEIADAMGISKNVVKVYKARACQRLGCTGRELDDACHEWRRSEYMRRTAVKVDEWHKKNFDQISETASKDLRQLIQNLWWLHP